MHLPFSRVVAVLGIATASFVASSLAHAQAANGDPSEPAGTPSHEAVAHPLRVEADAMLAGTSADPYGYFPRHTMVSLVLTGAYRTEHAEFELALPAVYDAYSFPDTPAMRDASSSQAAFGNPVIGGFYARAFPFGRLRVGGSIALPVASSAPASEAALSGAAYSRTYDHAWNWRPGVLSVLPSVRLDNLEQRGFQYATELVVGTSIRVREEDEYIRNTRFLVNLSQDLAYRTGAFRVGGRAVVASAGDGAKISVMPYVGGDVDVAYFDIGLNIDLDNPFGIPAQDGLWAVRIRGGARF